MNKDMPKHRRIYAALRHDILTGKYQNGARPEGSRGSINHDIGGRLQPLQEAPVKAVAGETIKVPCDRIDSIIAFSAAIFFPARRMRSLPISHMVLKPSFSDFSLVYSGN